MEIYRYPGLWDLPARCGVEILRHDTGGATVILTELPDNPGSSVTNLAATLATRLRAARLADLAPAQIRWIEHYPARGQREATFDELTLTWDPAARTYRAPAWRRLTPDEIRQLGYEPDEVASVVEALVRRCIPVAHEGGDLRIDGYAVSRSEVRALFHAARGDVDDFLRRFDTMREYFDILNSNDDATARSATKDEGPGVVMMVGTRFECCGGP